LVSYDAVISACRLLTRTLVKPETRDRAHSFNIREATVFEEAMRNDVRARWHLGSCGWRTYRKREKRRTAELDPASLCLNCARAAVHQLTQDDQAGSHGVVIRAAAARHLLPSPVSGLVRP
jgi:hypothetical protein